MGNKTGRSTSVKPEKPIKSEAFIYYLNREEGNIFHLKDTKIDKKTFPKPKKFAKDSGIGYLNECSIFLVGGTSASNSLKKKSLIIDMDQMFIRNISPLPLPCKLGSIHVYRSYVYYAGGLRFNDDPSIGSNLLGLPLMRYKVLENYWEIFSGEAFAKTFAYNNLLYGFNIDTLIDPGTFIFKNKLYYFAGRHLNGKPNNEVYSLDLNQAVRFIKEPVVFSQVLYSPICAQNSSSVFICGGKDLVGLNKRCFCFDGGFSEVQGKELEVCENHPLKHTDEYTVLTAFPKFALKVRDGEEWTLFNLTGSNYMVSAVTVSVKGSSSRKNLPPVTPRSRNSKVKDDKDVSGQRDQRYNTTNSNSTVHLSFFPVNGEESKRVNSPEKRSSKDIVYVQAPDLEIIDKNNDFLFKIRKKVGVKFIGLILKRLDKVELGVLENNQIWQNFGLVHEISIGEISGYLDEKLKEEQYKYQDIKKIIRFIYQNCENPYVKTKRLNEILEKLQLPEVLVNLSRETTTFILSRMLKAIAAYR